MKNFVIDRNLLESCKTAHARSQAEDEKGKMKDTEEAKKAEKEARKKTEDTEYYLRMEIVMNVEQINVKHQNV